jgi:hypothetical protein
MVLACSVSGQIKKAHLHAGGNGLLVCFAQLKLSQTPSLLQAAKTNGCCAEYSLPEYHCHYRERQLSHLKPSAGDADLQRIEHRQY